MDFCNGNSYSGYSKNVMPNEMTLVICPKCNSYVYGFAYLQHYHQCIDYSPKSNYYCNHCEVKYESHSALNAHVLSSHTFNCKLCGRTFDNKGIFVKHMAKHSVKSKVYKCEVCDVLCDSRRDLSNHKSSRHVYQCKHCQTHFKSEPLLVHHEATHEEFSCRFCTNEFESNDDFQNHICSIEYSVQPH